MGNVALSFDYVNWRGQQHSYLVVPERIELGPYDKGGAHEGEPFHWVMHAEVIERSHQERPGRRTFLLGEVMNLKEVQRT